MSNRYDIVPDAPGHPDTAFKVFNGSGIKVATLNKAQVIEALGEDVKERNDENERLRAALQMWLDTYTKPAMTQEEMWKAKQDAAKATRAFGLKGWDERKH